jgi:hypothetical protein
VTSSGEALIRKRRDVRVVVLLRGGAATARHLAVTRGEHGARAEAADADLRSASETGFRACRRRRQPVRGEMPFPARCGSAWPGPEISVARHESRVRLGEPGAFDRARPPPGERWPWPDLSLSSPRSAALHDRRRIVRTIGHAAGRAVIAERRVVSSLISFRRIRRVVSPVASPPATDTIRRGLDSPRHRAASSG